LAQLLGKVIVEGNKDLADPSCCFDGIDKAVAVLVIGRGRASPTGLNRLEVGHVRWH
jgi:hypothetical protein